MKMAFKGSLKEAGLADVCQLLALGMKTGCLSVTDRSRFGQVHFENGRITHARIVNRRDRLGDMLVHDGLLSHEQLEEVLAVQARAPDRRLGELLIDRGLIQRHDLERYVLRQIEEAVYNLFTWARGSFFFQAGQRPESGELLVSINPESLLLEAARRIDEWTVIEKKIPSLALVYRADHDKIAATDAALDHAQRQLLPLLDGTRSLREIVELTGLMEFDVAHAVFGLLQANLARQVGQRPEADDVVADQNPAERGDLARAFFRAGMLEDAQREYRRLLDVDGDDGNARLHLAVIALRERRPLDAVRQLRLLLEHQGASFAAFMNLSVALQMLGRDRDALLVLDEAADARPHDPLVALARGSILLRQRRVADARREFTEATRLWSESDVPPARYYHHAALAAALQGDHAEAARLAAEGIASHPESAPLHLVAGLIAERHSEPDEAERRYLQAMELDSSLPQAYKNLGDVAYRRGRLEQALSLYERAAEMAPGLGDDLFTKLGDLRYRSRDLEGAIRYWKRALELNPDNDLVRNNLEIVTHAG